MAKTVPYFGQLYRAAASGYKWAPEFRLFVRIQKAGAFFRVEIQPATFTPDANDLIHVEPWHGQEAILNHAPVFNKYMGRSTPHTFYMDEDGLELPPPPENRTPPVAEVVMQAKAEESVMAKKSARSEVTKSDPEPEPYEGVDPAFRGSK